MKFNLILCSIGRDKEVENFLISLANQTYKNYTLIVIDQNKDDRLYSLIQKYTNKLTKIKYFKVNFRGLSKARNFGLKQLDKDADIIAFPDDDCEYPPVLLQNVAKFFSENPKYSILTGISIDKKTNQISSGRFLKTNTEITFSNVFRTAISFTIFIKKSSIPENIKFDEALGAGSEKIYKSGEETDFILQLLEHGLKGFYYPETIYVYHPNKITKCNSEIIKYNYNYALGAGAVLKKHLLHKKNIKVIVPFISLTIRPVGGILYSLIKLDFCKVKFHFYSLLGRWKGFLKYPD